ncbi:MAG TPA: hypothetical protein VMC09_11585 [Anaerolineales bacterium]|nr:hypothetical protein [Anaerolineales bacterium]
MVTDEEVSRLRGRIVHLEGQIAFLYKHLGVEFVPEPAAADDPRILEAIRNGKTLDAIRLFREIHGVGMGEATQGVDEIKGRLGI